MDGAEVPIDRDLQARPARRGLDPAARSIGGGGRGVRRRPHVEDGSGSGREAGNGPQHPRAAAAPLAATARRRAAGGGPARRPDVGVKQEHDQQTGDDECGRDGVRCVVPEG